MRFLALILAFLLYVGTACGFSVVDSINELRIDPVGKAFDLGLSWDTLQKSWKDLFSVVSSGLMPLSESEELDAIADKILNALSSGKSFNTKATESFGLIYHFEAYLAFEQMIPPEKAEEVILRQVFIKALEAESSYASLLFPLFTHVGYAFKTVRLKIGGDRYNVYALCVVLGISRSEINPHYIVGEVEEGSSVKAVGALQPVTPFVWPGGLFYIYLSQNSGWLILTTENGQVVRRQIILLQNNALFLTE